ncbi:MAG: heme NO-binding domain-containing protein [Paracoccaceae bacterium]
MHGLINRAIQGFVVDSYGLNAWQEVALRAGLGFAEFESMLVYEDAVTERTLDAASARLDRPREVLLEDLGTYLVSHPNTEALRRLLRFGGESYEEFLHSLEELPERARLAVSDLHLPELELREAARGRFLLACGPGPAGFGAVLMGVLRAMADDYGALVILDRLEGTAEREIVQITLCHAGYSEGRAFELGARAG